MKLSPSNAHIWAPADGCRGYIKMTANYPPSPPRPEAAEGTIAHAIAREFIDKYRHLLQPNPEEYVDKLRDGVLITQEMYDAADMYARDVLDVARKTQIFGGEYLGIEMRLPCPEIHPDMTGICDSFIFARRAGHLFIWEFKYGHSPVDEYENWQAICYLSGIYSTHGLNGYDDQKTTVHIRVVQPRTYAGEPIREWTVKLSDIRPYVNIAREGALIASGENPPVTSGTHCQYCVARYNCPSALKTALALYETVSAPVPEKINDTAIGALFQVVNRAKAAIDYLSTGLEEEIKGRIRGGHNVLGYSLEPSYGRTKWSRPTADIINLGNLMGVNLRKEDQTITPDQAMSAGLDESIVKLYTIRQQTGHKLIPINLQNVRRILQ